MRSEKLMGAMVKVDVMLVMRAFSGPKKFSASGSTAAASTLSNPPG